MLGFGIGGGGSGGGTLRAQTVTANVPLTTGLLSTVSTFGLLAPCTFAKTSGSTNLTINSTTGGISATAALTAGATQSLVGTITSADSVVVPFTANLTGVAALVISGSPAAATVGDTTVFTPTISGGSGSYVSLAVLSGALPDGRSISGLTVAGTYTVAGSFSYTLRVTDSAGATADLVVSTTVAAAGAQVLAIAATRGRPLSSVAGSNRQVMARSWHQACGPITALKIVFGNFRITTAGETLTGFGAATLTASVEYPAGTFTQILFGGSATGSVSDGGNITSDMTANVNIPDGADFWIRMYGNFATGTPYNNWRNAAKGEVTYGGASGVVDMTMGGTIPASGDYSLPPLMILAMTSSKSVMIIGDSKSWGQNDTSEQASSVAGPGIRGEIARAFAPVASTLPFVNFASPGLQAYDWINTPAYVTNRAALLGYATHYVINLGRNDFWQRNRSQAQVQGDLQVIVNQIRAANSAAKITLCTQTHASNSTDNWTTTANQTTTNTTRNATRNAFNDLVRAGTALTGNNNGYFEISDQVETSRGSSIWPADGVTPFYSTPDGIHEQPAFYALAASAVDLSKFT